ncbi:RDD family protein [Pseudooctadecabacter jejudonensis]|uniref:RDD family protein n=1 Tax=Pseudooctadecabacter jejudonensis TaxID=1391910 RepID=A0A1Y5RLH4_9RHOB|nr:RDD family protein [Pseudooctadecabacter jejudonensis]SLN19195.1 RDD family protein [Pseudooctadecabacter jejudonensis]
MTYYDSTPDPQTQPDFYTSVQSKRLIAWFIDLAATAALAAVLTIPFLIFGLVLIVPLLFIPLIWACTGFVYRWMTISSGSATWGMRMMAIELRDREGRTLDSQTALLHTAGTYLSFAVAPLQLVSIASMILTDRGQGLTDMILGTTMLNRGL